MKRQPPVITTIGILCSAALLLGLALYGWKRGGIAFSPGKLSAQNSQGEAILGFHSHAEFEGRCSLCHQPLAASQAELCLRCHTRVETQIQSGRGAHAKIAPAEQCSDCHSDHQGAGFDPVASSLGKFDHNRTRFSLIWHQVGYDAVPLACDACHDLAGRFAASDQSCSTCHNQHDQVFLSQHMAAFGTGCIACHDGSDRLVRFDHQQSKFHLQGKHVNVPCADCHARKRMAGLGQGAPVASQDVSLSQSSFRETPQDCQVCHAEPEVHRGLYSGDCSRCHTADAWKPARWNGNLFDHNRNTRFNLARHIVDAQGTQMTCRNCHQATQAFDLQACVACHTKQEERPGFMLEHQEQFGATCLDCHDGVDRMSNFDHAAFFPLLGAHTPLECESCHIEKVFAGTPSQCFQCHAEPQIHAGFFGLRCQYCHIPDAWQPALLRQHTFPLAHGLQSPPGDQQEETCQVCHAGSLAEYSCYGCHEHQPQPILAAHLQAGVSELDLPACVQCHPAGVTEDGTSP